MSERKEKLLEKEREQVSMLRNTLLLCSVSCFLSYGKTEAGRTLNELFRATFFLTNSFPSQFSFNDNELFIDKIHLVFVVVRASRAC